MALRSTFRLEGMAAVNAAILDDIRKRASDAIEAGGAGLQEDLRAATRSALGDRLAKAWRRKTYGSGTSESPAAFIWSNAPKIIEGNIRGGTIVPVNGTEFLALPTDNVPQRRGRGAKAKMSPEEVEAYFNQDLVLRPGKKPGTLLGYVEVVRGRSRRRAGFRQATKGRLKQGRKVELVLMFTFARSVRKLRTIDADAIFRKWRDWTRRRLQEG